jgi:hypothetical protein
VYRHAKHAHRTRGPYEATHSGVGDQIGVPFSGP